MLLFLKGPNLRTINKDEYISSGFKFYSVNQTPSSGKLLLYLKGQLSKQE